YTNVSHALCTCLHSHSAYITNHYVIIEEACYFTSDFLQKAEIDIAIGLLWSRNGDKDDLRILYAVFYTAGETQPMRRHIAMNDFFKPGFINWHLAGLQLLDFLRVIIDSYDVMPDIGETGNGHQAK